MAEKTKTKAAPKGPFVVINPRGIPRGQFIIREEGGETWFEGDTYAGEKAAMWLGLGFIRVPAKGGVVPKSKQPVLHGEGYILPAKKVVKGND